MSKFLTTISGKIMEYIPKSMGATGHVRIPKETLAELAKADESGVAQRILEGMQNPSLDVAYKAQHNYSVAALNLRDGQKSVAKGAISVVNPGEQATVKARLSVGENGEVLHTSGFVDASKYPDINNASTSIARRNGRMTTDVRVGEAFGEHVSVDTAKAEELIGKFPNPKGQELIKNYHEGLTEIATSANKAMGMVRDTFAGRPAGSAIKPVFEKVEKVKTIEPADLSDKLAIKVSELTKDAESFKNINKKSTFAIPEEAV